VFGNNPDATKIITVKQLKIMKKLFFFFAMLVGITASAQTGITVMPINADYPNQTVRFSVSWLNSSRTGTHNSKVWVFIDYRTVMNNVPSGSWTRALISGTPTATTGTSSLETGNDKGFWLQGTSGSSGTYNATVTVKLSGVPAKFNWCAYVTDYPPNATINNGTYTLKGSSPFTINTSITESGKTYSGVCITTLTDATGCPGIINHSFSVGAINSTSSTVQTGTTPAAITSNTDANSGGGFTYRWVRTGTPSNTYTDNSAGHSFSASEVSSAGTWTYYREVRDNTCNTTTWSRSLGSYILTVIACPYTGSDLYMTSSYPCRQLTSGAKNWEAYIQDSRDSRIYRITQFSNGSWWFAEDLATTLKRKDFCSGLSWYAAQDQPACPSGWSIPTFAQLSARWPTGSNGTDNYNGALNNTNLLSGFNCNHNTSCVDNGSNVDHLLVSNYNNAIQRTNGSSSNWVCYCDPSGVPNNCNIANTYPNIYGRVRCFRQL
jgi:hypothetical protein